MISRFTRSLVAIIIAIFLLATVAFFHPPSRAYIDPWTGEFFGDDGIERYERILPTMRVSWSAPTGATSESTSGGEGKGVGVGSGGVIMSKLGNETAKYGSLFPLSFPTDAHVVWCRAELGRSHTMTLRYPENPTQDEREALEAYMYLTSRLYPCGECATEFQALLKRFPPQVRAGRSKDVLLCSVHNEVNARLDKPFFDCSKLDAEYDCGCGDATTSTSATYARPTSSSDDTGVVEPMDLERDVAKDDVTGVRLIKGGRR
ncbi:ERV/ALR sulfhydryl oxidase domain-containing protein [Lanmaoa asiatica]|nr:ERV/ALR sulfhydryl oxidase domain-containing protein [Lanmaoa asiatica]